MNASTILNMITDKQLDSPTEVAAFLSADTDCYLLLMGIQHVVESYKKAEYAEVAAGYAAVNHPDELAHFINDLTDLTVLDTLSHVAARESVVGEYTEHVYTPMVEKVFLEKGKAFIRHNGLVACNTPEHMFGVLDESMQALGFYDCDKPYVSQTLEQFELFYQRLLDTTYFVYNKTSCESEDMPDKQIITFVVNIPASTFPEIYAGETKEWRMRIERDASIRVALDGIYVAKTRTIELTEESCLRFKSGSRTTTQEYIYERYKNALVAAAMKLIHAKVPAVKSIKSTHFRILPNPEDFMARVLGEGAELMAKEAAYASDSSKTAINAKKQPKVTITAFAQKPAERGLCPECGQMKTCDMDEIEHDTVACDCCGLEVPKSCVLKEWQLDPVTWEWTLKPEVK